MRLISFSATFLFIFTLLINTAGQAVADARTVTATTDDANVAWILVAENSGAKKGKKKLRKKVIKNRAKNRAKKKAAKKGITKRKNKKAIKRAVKKKAKKKKIN